MLNLKKSSQKHAGNQDQIYKQRSRINPDQIQKMFFNKIIDDDFLDVKKEVPSWVVVKHSFIPSTQESESLSSRPAYYFLKVLGQLIFPGKDFAQGQGYSWTDKSIQQASMRTRVQISRTQSRSERGLHMSPPGTRKSETVGSLQLTGKAAQLK